MSRYLAWKAPHRSCAGRYLPSADHRAPLLGKAQRESGETLGWRPLCGMAVSTWCHYRERRRWIRGVDHKGMFERLPSMWLADYLLPHSQAKAITLARSERRNTRRRAICVLPIRCLLPTVTTLLIFRQFCSWRFRVLERGRKSFAHYRVMVGVVKLV
jgi:hypothetical protein